MGARWFAEVATLGRLGRAAPRLIRAEAAVPPSTDFRCTAGVDRLYNSLSVSNYPKSAGEVTDCNCSTSAPGGATGPAFDLSYLIEFEGKIVRVLEKGETLAGRIVQANRFNGDAFSF